MCVLFLYTNIDNSDVQNVVNFTKRIIRIEKQVILMIFCKFKENRLKKYQKFHKKMKIKNRVKKKKI